MIKLNDKLFKQGHFPDGTLALQLESTFVDKNNRVYWNFENNEELLTIYFITRHMQELGLDVELYLPYIPNARMDRVKNNEDVFTLKYFTEIINSLNFKSVIVLDPHSSVSEALINRLYIKKPTYYIKKVINKINNVENISPLMFYPDEGSVKRYTDTIDLPYVYGIKKRDWKTGDILGLDIIGSYDQIKGNNILMVDDIIAYGGTLYYSALKLKEMGANNIYIYASHVENSILDEEKGKLIKSGIITKIYTTNSIFNKNNELIEIMELDKEIE